MNNVDKILSGMSLDEKSELCMGKDNWFTKEFPQHGIPSIRMSDGTNGIRINRSPEEIAKIIGRRSESTFFDVTVLSQDSEKMQYIQPATCYPSGSATACSWDRDLVAEIASSVAEECHYKGVSLLLGPAMNIRRNPLGGRSFEYFSEDPVVSGEISKAYVSSLQENGIGGTIKHFTCNNSETLRTKTDSVVEERAMREIYLAGFERALQANPWSVMSSYNLLNGVQMAENKEYLTDILRGEWGYEGMVVSDWWGIKDRVKAAEAGNDLEMPYNAFNPHILSDAVRAGELSEETLNKVCRRILTLIFKAVENKKTVDRVDYDKHHAIARKAIEESIVLLKNEDKMLPLQSGGKQRILVAGSIAKTMRYQGGGCALINPTRLDIPYDEIVKIAGEDRVEYSAGYDECDQTSPAMIKDAVSRAQDCDVVILFAGLAVSTDIEGCDRKKLDIEESHIQLIEEISKVNPNIILVLSNGESVTMPWENKAKAILETFMCGQAGGSAVANIIFGRVNPSGKLTVTYVEKIEDLPSYPEFPGENARHLYNEGIYVGYRYYEVKKIKPLYPFGHGLSYTDFSYNNIQLDHEEMDDTQTLTVKFEVENSGAVEGKEVVQLYVAPPVCRLRRPLKELKNFVKVNLKPGERKEVVMTLSYRDFAYYDPEFKDWIVDTGSYRVLVGKSSQDICLEKAVKITATKERHVRINVDTVHVELFRDEKATAAYFDYLIEKKVFNPEDIGDGLRQSFTQSFVGLYNTLPTYAKRPISKKDFQVFLDGLNKKLGRE
jgi:beta-glucosidase